MHLTSQNSSPTQQRTPQVIGVMQSQNNNSGNRGPRPLEQVTCYKVMQRGGLRRESKRIFHSVKRLMSSELCSVDIMWCLDAAGNWPWVLRSLPCQSWTFCDSDKFCRTLLSANKQENPAPKTDCQAAHCKIRANNNFLSHKPICLHWWV